ncbi:hypothetical protein PCANC_01130 [Puccinia coronata f. sp. avenae]|uniref:C2H2-type domain-containing protein n=1 Tax=Puccinia coronata f. sp. avenae TaxID=200324 RepID=A0A2N5W5V4_9BASI|nr:hypothetical protein PCASD_17358 [Puccinia coronata f. sp. avenae]PLW45337.1 hypothetical protein PCASD_03141 [Puccinia coronata f. sp. avenae]PLW57603.1 hypothetical protein PCANC_01130 [Puccinia coronata f. sp. avenae]
MLSSTRTITTDRRHIDPNPDRLQLISSSAGSASTTTPAVKPASLLLLSTSAEAAVAESKRFERSSRHSSLSNSFGSPPTHSSIKAHHQKLHPSSPPSPSSSSTSSSSALNHHHHRPLNYHHLTHPRNLSQSPLRNHHQQRIHHRFTQAASLQNNHHTPAPPNNNSSSTNNNRREQAKTGQLFKCEKCLKVYRHPQCLVKHRWEHTEYWADASKLMLSKHQQVQMLEAAAILAAPSGSLPESRSLWPAAVSSSEAGLLGSDQVNLEVIYSRQAARPTGNPHHHYRSSSTSCVLSRESRENTDIEMNEDRGPQGLVGHERRSAAAEDEPEDEIMFEMSLDGEESSYSNARHTGRAKQRIPERGGSVRSSSISSSVSGPPPIGYFERRNPQSVSSVISNLGSLQRSSSSTSAPKGSRLVASLPAMVAYQPALDTHNQANQFVYHASESIFKPMAPYQDSQLRFEGRRHFHPDLVDEDQFPPASLATAPASTGKSNSKPSTEDDSTTEEEDAEDDDDGWSPSTERERERVEGDEVIGMEL